MCLFGVILVKNVAAALTRSCWERLQNSFINDSLLLLVGTSHHADNMWILESNGDFLRGKRMWLKPGKKYLFGRVRKDGVNLAIDHKTVSRKHFLITISEVKDGDVGNVHARTTVAIEDLASKAGTNVDGELISSASKILKKDVTSVRPGSCPHELVVTWLPCVLTYGLNKKDIKNGLLQTKQARMKELDVKVVNEYLPGQTTHMISQKRNTPRTLQALIEGKPLVSEAFVDDLIYASTPSDLEAEESFCNLEADFDEGWPDESKYLPPAGKEPTKKPDDAYSPNPERAKVFEKHTFFFFDQAQYDMLLPPITVGHGKALFFEIKEKTTKIEDALTFIHNAIGTSGIAVIVKLTEQEESLRGNFIEKLCVKLGQQNTEQAALLDAILANDASSLHKPLRQATTSDRPINGDRGEASPQLQAEAVSQSLPSQPKTANGVQNSARTSSSSLSPVPDSAVTSQQTNAQGIQEPSQQSQQSATEDANPRPRKRARFAPVLETVKAFDDDFDPKAAVPYEDDEIEDEEEVADSPPQHSQPRGSQKSRTATTQTHVKQEPVSPCHRKGSVASFGDESDDGLDDFLPGAAAMKREQKEAEAKAIREGRPLKINGPPKSEVVAKPRKASKTIDVREASRAKRDADEEKARKAREELKEMQKNEEGNTGPRDLVKIQTFDLPVRGNGSSVNGYRGEAWKPEWNGRKNFKGFRRAGDDANGTTKRDKIIVPIVPWSQGAVSRQHANAIENGNQRSQKTTSQNHAKSKSTPAARRRQQSRHDSDSEEQDQVSNVDENDHISPETARLQKEAEDVLDHPVDITEPRQTRHGDSQDQSSSRASAGKKTTRSAKRPASSTPTGRSSTAKKQKTQPIVVADDSDSPAHEDDDDDSDDNKFTFGVSKKFRQRK